MQQLQSGAKGLGAVFARWVVLLAASLLSGCYFDRLNHIHSEENLTEAKRASDEFEAVRSDRSGLPAKMLTNLAAQQALRETVGAKGNEYFDLADLHLLEDISWQELRVELYSDLGYSAGLTASQTVVRQLAGASRLPAQRRPAAQKEATILAYAAARAPGPQLDDFIRAASTKLTRDHLQDHPEAQLQSLSADSPITLKEEDVVLFDTTTFLRTLFSNQKSDAENFKLLALTLTEKDDAVTVKRIASDWAPPGSRSAILAQIQRNERLSAPQRKALRDHLALRMKRLEQVVKVYEVLLKGERARIALFKRAQKTTLEQFKKQSKATDEAEDDGKGSEDKDDKEPAGALTLLFHFRKAITGYWKDKELRAAFLAGANELQRLLVQSAEQSADPASTLSLVPLLGEGLGDQDLVRLDDYLSHLKKRTEDETLEDAEVVLKLISAKLGASGAKDKEDKETKKKIDEFYAAYKELSHLLSDDGDEGDDLEDLFKEIQEVVGELRLDLDVFNAETAQEGLKKVATQVLENPRANPEAWASLVEFAVVSNYGEEVDKAVGPVLTVERRAALSDLAKDLANEGKQAAQRAVDLLVRLQALHQQLAEENVRHYLALSVIVGNEVERWDTLSALHAELERSYQSESDDDAQLFASAESLAEWNAGISDAGAKHPAITPRTDVVWSLRLLAATADHHQKSAPADDAANEHTWRSAERLSRAVSILQRYQLMTTVNRRYATRNSIALIGELQEHEIRVREVVVSGVEAEISFGLSELVAFHQGGITQADLQLVIGLTQDALLGWIGGKL